MGDEKDNCETDSDVYFSKLKPYSAYDLPSEIMTYENQGNGWNYFSLLFPFSLSLQNGVR